MSHFAEIDENGIVLRVLVGNNTLPNEGQDWFEEHLGGTWVQTSYNTFGGQHLNGGTAFRKNFAAKGYTYDETRDAFYAPQPFPSWVLDEDTCLWQAPVEMPEDADSVAYDWDEDSQAWVAI